MIFWIDGLPYIVAVLTSLLFTVLASCGCCCIPFPHSMVERCITVAVTKVHRVMLASAEIQPLLEPSAEVWEEQGLTVL